MGPDQTESKSDSKRITKMARTLAGGTGLYESSGSMDQVINQSIHGKVESRECEREGREEIEEEEKKRLEQVT